MFTRCWLAYHLGVAQVLMLLGHDHSTQDAEVEQAASDAALWQREKAALEKGWRESSMRLDAEVLRLRDHIEQLEHHSRYHIFNVIHVEAAWHTCWSSQPNPKSSCWPSVAIQNTHGTAELEA